MPANNTTFKQEFNSPPDNFPAAGGLSHETMSHKNSAYAACIEKLLFQKEELLHQLSQLNEALDAEAKSSAGDKHETGRARIQTEIEKVGNLLLLVEKNINELTASSNQSVVGTVQKGSFIKTSGGNFYMGIALGKITNASNTFYAVSPASPIGKLLLGKRVGENFQLNQLNYIIEAIE